MRRFFSFTDVSSTVVCSNAVCFTAVSSLLSVSLLSVPLLSVWARAADEESCCSENQFPVSLASQLFNCTLERRPMDATGATINFPLQLKTQMSL